MKTLTRTITIIAMSTSLLTHAWAKETTLISDQLYDQYMAATEENFDSDDLLASLQTLPDHPLTQVLTGSASTMVGRDAMMPWNKLSYTEQGLDLMRKAVRRLTDEHKNETFRGEAVDLAVKKYAAFTYLSVPSFFNTHPQGLAWAEELLNDPRTQQTKGAHQQAWNDLATLAKNVRQQAD